jgi:hypothetical protein
MNYPSFDLNSLVASYRDAVAPAVHAQQEGLKTIERVARYQFAVAGDYLDWSLAQAKAGVSPKSVADLVGQRTALNTQFSEKLRARAVEFNQIVTETQGIAKQLFGETSAKIAQSMKKAA